MRPVFYIAEAVSIPPGLIALAALILIVALAALLAWLFISSRRLRRLALEADWSNFIVLGLIFGLDALFFWALFSNSIPVGLVPVVVHIIALLTGWLKRRSLLEAKRAGSAPPAAPYG